MAEEKKAEKPSARRDLLRSIEREVQAKWASMDPSPYHVDAPSEYDHATREKYFVTFPYPYMNGALHLGHAFTLGKAEFMARFQRLLGKDVLWPFGFHATGTPIAACAQKLQREFIDFGNPPVFPSEEEEAALAAKKAAAKQKAAAGAPPKKFEKKKGKAAKKKSKALYQYQILLEMGVPADEIPLFRDPRHWVAVFPALGREHLAEFGLAADFRRSFVTTDLNPYYSRFIEWQFNTLRRRGGKLEFGSRMSVFSPASGQICADHDRASGEGVGPQEYTLILVELLAPFPPALASLEGRSVKLAAATLRPETMYGQTNMWALPDGDYGAYQMKSGDVYVCSARSALNMSYQEMTAERGRPELLCSFKGADLMGAACRAPLATYERVYVLPLMTIKMSKGTGIVTCVPSDAPDDYAALKDVKTKAALRAKFGLRDEQVLPFDVVPIIDIPGLGTSAAARMCEERKVQSQNDREKLDAIKGEVYLKGFYEGVLQVGPHAGQKVEDAKPVIRAELVAAGDAAPYFEPESLVMSRNGDECVVALTDQWLLAYGEEGWRRAVDAHVDSVLETFNPRAKKMYKETVAWLKEWACSREFGLGTRLPWDDKYLIESLSDSTVYMAYYTVAHHLQSTLNGDTPGLSGLRADQLTDEVLDYVFLGDERPEFPASAAAAGVDRAAVDRMRSEFEYWYPMDLRVSGKDLIKNHLTMSMYNHAAVWEGRPEMMPRGYFTNGHILVDKEKMSKSTGNFITLSAAIRQYSCDATRLSLAEGGDSLNDANFDTKMTNSNILTLTKEIAWFAEVAPSLGGAEGAAGDDEPGFFDRVFASDVDACIRGARREYEQMLFHEALKHGFWGMLTARDAYRAAVGDDRVRPSLVRRYMRAFCVMLSPVCPHVAQHLWELAGGEGLVLNARWPEPAEAVPDAGLAERAEYVRKAARSFRTAHQRCKKPPNAAVALVAKALPPSQQNVVDAVLELAAAGKQPTPRDVQQALVARGALEGASKKETKNVMIFAASACKGFKAGGEAAIVGAKLSFDEAQLLAEHADYLRRGLDGVDSFEVVDAFGPDAPKVGKPPSPGEPVFVFETRQ